MVLNIDVLLDENLLGLVKFLSQVLKKNVCF